MHGDYSHFSEVRWARVTASFPLKHLLCLHWRKRNNPARRSSAWKACLLDICPLTYLGRDSFLCLRSNAISPGWSLMGLEGWEKISSSSFNFCPRKGYKKHSLKCPYGRPAMGCGPISTLFSPITKQTVPGLSPKTDWTKISTFWRKLKGSRGGNSKMIWVLH